MAQHTKTLLIALFAGLLLPACTITTAGGTAYTVRGPNTGSYGQNVSNCNYEIRVVNQTGTPVRARIASGYKDSGRIDTGNTSPWALVRGSTSKRMPTGESEFPFTHQISSTRTNSVEVQGLFGKRGLPIQDSYCPAGSKTKLLIFEVRRDNIYQRSLG